MRIVLFACLCLLPCFTAQAGEVSRPQGRNCALAAPPEAAGEEFNQGVVLRIYPRARDIDSRYSGCQLMWAPDGTKWVTVSVVAVENGKPVRLWWPDASETELLACRYKNGRIVVGDSESCPAPQFLIVRSVAPGCVEKMRTAVATGGVGAPQPQGCNHE